MGDTVRLRLDADGHSLQALLPAGRDDAHACLKQHGAQWIRALRAYRLPLARLAPLAAALAQLPGLALAPLPRWLQAAAAAPQWHSLAPLLPATPDYTPESAAQAAAGPLRAEHFARLLQYQVGRKASRPRP